MPAQHVTHLLRNLTICTTNTFLQCIKTVRCKCLKTFCNPWLTKGLLKSIRPKAKLKKNVLKNPKADHENANKTFKNKLTHLITTAKESTTIINLKTPKTTSKLHSTFRLLSFIVPSNDMSLVIPQSLMHLSIIKRATTPSFSSYLRHYEWSPSNNPF